MASMEDIVELDGEVGDLLIETCDEIVSVGNADNFGWAAWYDVSGNDEVSGNVVIVGMWPDGTMRVESFADCSVAGWRWLQWEELFRELERQPERGDMVVIQIIGPQRSVLQDVRSSVIFDNWNAMADFANRVGVLKKGKQIWFLDRITGNYFPLDL